MYMYQGNPIELRMFSLMSFANAMKFILGFTYQDEFYKCDADFVVKKPIVRQALVTSDSGGAEYPDRAYFNRNAEQGAGVTFLASSSSPEETFKLLMTDICAQNLKEGRAEQIS